jgi:4-hydroxy 2-oxovalerate aldolase
MGPLKKDADNMEILDCTIRDGGYVNNWDFDKKVVRETYRALSKSGIDYVELGYHGSEKYFDKAKYGAFRFSSADDIAQACGNISGAKVALMVDYGKYDVKDLVQYEGTPVRLIRIAVHKDSVDGAIRCAAEIKRMGFLTALNLMGFTLYTPAERKRLARALSGAPVDYAYVVDSHGAVFPSQIKDLYGSLSAIKHIKWGFHSHNNLQMAFANTLSAIEAGVKIIDSSVFGMGRGAGNLPTEIVLAYLHLSSSERYNAIPVLNLVDRYFTKLHAQAPWGYNLPYMLSGIYDCHPNYPKSLIERKEYDIEDIWKILNVVKASAPIGFKKELLNDILAKGFSAKKAVSNVARLKTPTAKRKKTNVSYRGRHKDADFLILANGPGLKENYKQINAFIDGYKPVILAANYLGGLFKPNYHAFSNKRRFVDYIDTVDKDSRLLISQYIPPEMIREYTDREYETIHYDDADAPFDIHDGVISSHCRTVGLLLMGVAIVMGAKRIFAAGLDGYMGVNVKGQVHFYDEKDETESKDVLSDRHMGNLRNLEQIDEYLFSHKKEGIHIITPTSYAKFYKGIRNYINGGAISKR